MLMFEHLPSKAIPVKDKLAEKRTCQAPDRVQVEITFKIHWDSFDPSVPHPNPITGKGLNDNMNQATRRIP